MVFETSLCVFRVAPHLLNDRASSYLPLRAGSSGFYDGLIYPLIDSSTCVQAEEVKRSADQVAQLRRVGKGLGVFEFDRAIGTMYAEEEAD